MGKASKYTPELLQTLMDLIPLVLATGIIWRYIQINTPKLDPMWKIDWHWMIKKFPQTEIRK